jgi:hypothetical protein
MVTLDISRPSHISSHASSNCGVPIFLQEPESEGDDDSTIINQALMSAVYAFSARWLPLDHFCSPPGDVPADALAVKNKVVESIWRRAYKDVSRVMTMPSYRSILALYLFGITPTCSKNKDRRASDLCLEVSLRHYIRLRSASRISSSAGSRTYRNSMYNDYDDFRDREGVRRDDLEYTHSTFRRFPCCILVFDY